MIKIDKLREAADLLLEKYRYPEAFSIYDELYRHIWRDLSVSQWSCAAYTGKTAVQQRPVYSLFRDRYIDAAAGTICSRLYCKSLDQTLSEFADIMHGRLKCICYSGEVTKRGNVENILNEFLVLYTLVMQPGRNKKISPLFVKITPMLDANGDLVRIRPNLSRYSVEKLLQESAGINTDGRWKSVNGLLLEYLARTGFKNSELYRALSTTVGRQYYRSGYRNQNSYWGKRENEHSGNKGGYSGSKTYERGGFSSAAATEKEKQAYYGKLMELKGSVTKSQVRSNYLNLISLYHPDKVQHLGPELKELAEKKSKEINAAYGWLKVKYHL